MRRIIIPEVVFDHLAGAEIYPKFASFRANPPEIKERVIEDAKYLLAVNFDGYEDYPQPETTRAVESFLRDAQA